MFAIKPSENNNWVVFNTVTEEIIFTGTFRECELKCIELFMKSKN